MTGGEPIPTPNVSRFTPRTIVVGISALLFLASLALDGFYIDRQNPRASSPGIALLLVGWLGLFDGVFAWLANPLLGLAWITIWFPRLRWVSVLCAVAALSFALSFLLHDDILADEGGGRAAITAYGWGYWVWLASISTMIIAGAVVALMPRATASGLK